MNNNSILWFMDCKFFECRASIDGRTEEFSIFGRFALYSYAIGDFIDSIDLWFLNCVGVDDMLTAFCNLPSLHVIQLVSGFVVGRGKSNFVGFALFFEGFLLLSAASRARRLRDSASFVRSALHKVG